MSFEHLIGRLKSLSQNSCMSLKTSIALDSSCISEWILLSPYSIITVKYA